MPDFATLDRAARLRHLRITAGLTAGQCAGRDDLPPGTQTLLMLSPDEPAFWPAFRQGPEMADGQPDAMDRWSLRVIGDWAAELGATPLFPFGGPPYHPFIAWALASGHVHSSPVGMMVHPTAGLYLSFRGALALPRAIALPPTQPRPCDSCPDQPCLTACPVSALGPGGYDVPACKAYLVTPEGNDCMSKGCRARRACPSGSTHGRVEEHSAYHMQHFL